VHIPNEQWQDSKQQRGTSFEKDRFATTKKKEYEVKRSPIQERGFHLQTSQELRSRLVARAQQPCEESGEEPEAHPPAPRGGGAAHRWRQAATRCVALCGAPTRREAALC